MPKGRRRDLVLVLLALPFVFLLIPQIYNRTDPQLFGIPFFVWYQFAWVIGGSLITFVVYRVREGDRD
jgi:Protein of unknown function (DUF3311)